MKRGKTRDFDKEMQVFVTGGNTDENRTIASVCQKALENSGFKDVKLQHQHTHILEKHNEPQTLLDLMRATRPKLFSRPVRVVANITSSNYPDSENLTHAQRVIKSTEDWQRHPKILEVQEKEMRELDKFMEELLNDFTFGVPWRPKTQPPKKAPVIHLKKVVDNEPPKVPEAPPETEPK